MTKTYTEQWREGTLPLNHYYVKTKSGRYGINHTVLSFDGDKPRTRLEYSDRTEEVLAKVPSYDEIVKLEKKLEIATKALKEYADKDKWHYCSEDIEYFYTTKDGWYDAEQALKEMEGVK